ncbi:uncharacterized protein LOC135619162 [Musa acuminata AAA Group]|uniref:uncharacterized protein LOC135619162 n=1 Tax=Musa acuminata AAA Group TaxID=214697 RepID=UPI0031DD8035
MAVNTPSLHEDPDAFAYTKSRPSSLSVRRSVPRTVSSPDPSISSSSSSMDSKVVIALVLVFDVVAFALAIAAEQRRNTAQVVPDSEKEYTYCVYDSDIATGFGVGSLLLLLLSQLIITAVTRCYCCGPLLRRGGSRFCVFLLLLSCWLTFLVAEACLLAGSVQNARHTRYRGFYFMNDPSCEVLRKGVFAAGAAFVVLTAILSVFYYILYAKGRDSSYRIAESAIGMNSFS